MEEIKNTNFALVMALLALYLLPSIIAGVRSHARWLPIQLVNVLLGWSVIGYAVALVWSLGPACQCPHCAGGVRCGVSVCKHCGRDVPPPKQEDKPVM